MNKNLKRIPKFKSESAERLFWQKADSTKFIDFSKAKNWRFPNLKLSSKPVTLRLPKTLIEKAKLRAHRLDIPYQTFIKQLIFRELVTAWNSLFSPS